MAPVELGGRETYPPMGRSAGPKGEPPAGQKFFLGVEDLLVQVGMPARLLGVRRLKLP